MRDKELLEKAYEIIKFLHDENFIPEQDIDIDEDEEEEKTIILTDEKRIRKGIKKYFSEYEEICDEETLEEVFITVMKILEYDYEKTDFIEEIFDEIREKDKATNKIKEKEEVSTYYRNLKRDLNLPYTPQEIKEKVRFKDLENINELIQKLAEININLEDIQTITEEKNEIIKEIMKHGYYIGCIINKIQKHIKFYHYNKDILSAKYEEEINKTVYQLLVTWRPGYSKMDDPSKVLYNYLFNPEVVKNSLGLDNVDLKLKDLDLYYNNENVFENVEGTELITDNLQYDALYTLKYSIEDKKEYIYKHIQNKKYVYVEDKKPKKTIYKYVLPYVYDDYEQYKKEKLKEWKVWKQRYMNKKTVQIDITDGKFKNEYQEKQANNKNAIKVNIRKNTLSEIQNISIKKMIETELTQKEQLIIELYFLQDYTQEQVGEMLKESQGTISDLIKNIKEKLQKNKILRDEYFD